ncbi:uncharacterized protein LOC133290437 [Gastrolobium bilobum]|uniref:uncharacterized protein LOC133290437 n=1 Tax=Gastrolobium bilobum TaxID=150636 RepID=UPI002AB257B3|nr:uncharacterized protein LOC133290437 [Gastrolobium bilobum]
MVNPIPKFAKNVWTKWNIRGAILTSLSLQVVLIFLAPFRKRTRNSIVVLSLWSTYLIADYVANFCIGLISNKYGDQDTSISNVNDFLLAFWAPFLLLHLGGPDTITAFSLEDNELWLRHMLGLFVQLGLTGYVFLLTLPANTMWLPTTLVFLAGIIKYAERTRSLQLASNSNFRKSCVRDPDPGPNYAKLMEEYKSRKDAGLPTSITTMPEPELEPGANSTKAEVEKPQKNKNESEGKHEKETLDDVEVVRKAHGLFDTFKGLIVDMIYSFYERSESREYFLKQNAEDALRVIEVELNFMYESFYTKSSVVRTTVGYIFRFVAVSCTVAALVLFVFDQKHGCNEFDVVVTYTLLYGAVALDTVSLLMLIFSDDTFAFDPSKKDRLRGIKIFIVSISRGFLKFNRLKWKEEILSRNVLCRRWSESIAAYNLIYYCLYKKERWWDRYFEYIGATEFVEQLKYEKKKKLRQGLWSFIFEELKRKSGDVDDVETIQRICSSRGSWVIQEGEIRRHDIDKLMPYVDANIVTFDQSLIQWHIATDLLFYDDHKNAQDEDVEEGRGNTDKEDELFRDFSKLLSDYMLYLLIMQPNMMSAIGGIGQIRFQDTWAEANKFFSKRDQKIREDQEKKEMNDQKKRACRKLIDVCTDQEPSSVKGDRSKSVLFDACRLANEIKKLNEKKRWKIIAQVWVELLSYAASNCRPITHVQQLGKGGEFISLVWLLMTHLGLAKQFQIKEGHARAKLIVGEEDMNKSS